jgi:hypothetical protein
MTTPNSTAMTSPFTPDDKIKAVLTERRLKLTELDNIAEQHGVTIKNLYVVWNEERFSVLHDPMTNKPVSARNKKMLEEVAKSFNGTIITAAEAVAKLIKGR